MKKIKKVLIACLCVAMIGCVGAFAACGSVGTVESSSVATEQKPEYGTIKGVVMDEDGEPLEGAEVYYTEEDAVETDENGAFEIRSVKVGAVELTAKLNGYADTPKSLTEAEFNSEGTVNVNIVMAEGKGTIKGVVTMEGNTTVRLANAIVKLGSLTATTDEKGEYEFTEVPMLKTQSMTATLDGYEEGRKTVNVRSYKNFEAKIDFQLVQNDCAEIAGIKPYQLESLTALDDSKTTLSSGDISSLMQVSRDNIQGSSKVETHTEGICLNADTKEDRNTIVSFVYAKVNVTNSHQFLTAYARQFFGQNGGGTYEEEKAGQNLGKFAQLGLYLFDETGKFVNEDNFVTINKEDYMAVTFDLSAYAGKTITIILGTRTGYHCCLSKIEFSEKAPEYLTVNGVDGLTSIRKHDKVAAGAFDTAALKDKWSTGGPVATIDAGYELNSGDPWKAEHYTEATPQPVNSYTYITTDLTAETAYLTVSTTIVNLENCKDPGNTEDPGPYFPYISVILIDKDGNKLYQSAWEKIEVAENNAALTKNYDLSAYVQNDVTVVIACNVGYRATITGVTFGAKSADTPAPANVALPVSKEESVA